MISETILIGKDAYLIFIKGISFGVGGSVLSTLCILIDHVCPHHLVTF